jgi:hypothetical protein
MWSSKDISEPAIQSDNVNDTTEPSTRANKARGIGKKRKNKK